jgi:methylthioxylose transferase
MQTDPKPARTSGGRAPWVGLSFGLALIATAVLVPRVFGWEVWSHGKPASINVPPLHSKWAPKVGVGTIPALLIAALGWWYAVAWAERLPWRRLLVLSYVVGLGWLLALA